MRRWLCGWVGWSLLYNNDIGRVDVGCSAFAIAWCMLDVLLTGSGEDIYSCADL